MLPAYGARAFADRMCCPLTGSAELHPAEPLPPGHAWADIFMVTARAEQFLRDRRAALLRLVDGLIAAVRRMLMTMLAASVRGSAAIGFLLVMLAAVRHFGRRGEPDHDASLACLRPDVNRGLAIAA